MEICRVVNLLFVSFKTKRRYYNRGLNSFKISDFLKLILWELKLMYVRRKRLFFTSQESMELPIIKIYQSVNRGRVVVCCKNYTKHLNVMRWQNREVYWRVRKVATSVY